MVRALSVAALLLCSSCFQPTTEEEAGLATDSSSAGLCSAVTLVNPGNSVQPATECLCTRRDATTIGSCRKGVGESASATIGPAGGTVTLAGQQGSSVVPFKLTFPPGALASDTVITVTETALPPPGADWSPVYRIDPVGLEIGAGVQLSVPNSQGNGSSMADGHLSLFSSGRTECALEAVRDNYVNAGFNTGTITKLGYVMVGYAERGLSPSCH